MQHWWSQKFAVELYSKNWGAQTMQYSQQTNSNYAVPLNRKTQTKLGHKDWWTRTMHYPPIDRLKLNTTCRLTNSNYVVHTETEKLKLCSKDKLTNSNFAMHTKIDEFKLCSTQKLTNSSYALHTTWWTLTTVYTQQ